MKSGEKMIWVSAYDRAMQSLKESQRYTDAMDMLIHAVRMADMELASVKMLATMNTEFFKECRRSLGEKTKLFEILGHPESEIVRYLNLKT